MPAYYREDLAHIHATGFGDFARRSAAGVLGLLRRAEVTGGLVVELGCGSGITARHLTRAGYAVLGIDPAPALLRRAGRTAPKARFRRGTAQSAALPPCDAVLALGEVLGYCGEEPVTPRTLLRFFRAVHAALPPGGVLLFDLAGPGRGAVPAPGRVQGPDWELWVERQEDVRRRLLTRHIVAWRRLSRAYRRSEETHVLRLFAPAQVLALLERAGFRARALRGYGRLRLPPGWTAFLAQKPRRPARRVRRPAPAARA